MSTKQPQNKAVQAPQKIQFSSQITFLSHTFRLSNETVQRYDHVKKDTVAKDHGHIFHTKDAGGRDLDKSNSVGGHFHKIKVTPQGDGNVPLIECGPPMRMQKVKKGKTYVNVEIPYMDKEKGEDNHRHTFTYQGTQQVSPRHANIEANRAQEILQTAKEKPIPGIFVGSETGTEERPPAE